jgi:hypothetical protein
MGNKYGSSLTERFREAVDIRTDFMVYKNEHNRLIDALAKAKGISIAQLGAGDV